MWYVAVFILGMFIGDLISLSSNRIRSTEYLSRLVSHYNKDYEQAVNKFYTGEKPWEEK
jgi:hypothetical protein